MWALLQKEISGFFSSLTGYIVILVFLTLNGLFLWIFPGTTNITDSGYASLRPMFEMAPWIFLFLIPAITMRAFAEEKKSGTLELLMTRPLSNLQIILGKYYSTLVLAILAIVPTLVYYFSVILLGDTVGNIDHGATWGSYIGLVLLAACYAAIGIFSSTITDNVIVAFLIGVFLCFLTFSGFDYAGNLFSMGALGSTVQNLGIEAHYQSMSRGVIDTRDIIYFVSLALIFISLSNLILNSKRWK